MKRIIYLFILLVAASAASLPAQNLPERGAVRKGNKQFNKGNYEESISRYEEALKHVPGQFEATYNLGNALYKAERFDHAEKTLRTASLDSLRTDTERAESFYNLGNAQFKQQKYQEALESYKQSLRLNPSDMEAKYNYAYTKRMLQQNQDQNGGGNDQKNQDQQNQQGQDRQNQSQKGDQGKQDPKPGKQNPDNGQDQQDQQNQQGENPQDQQDQQDQQGQGDRDSSKDDPREGEGNPQPVPAGISEQEQQQMLDAIQAQEDRTQEKLKERRGVVVRGNKNW